MKEFQYPSSSGPKVYTARINDNGLLSCDCLGWTSKKEGKPRHCKHTREVEQLEHLTLEERSGQMFVVGDSGGPMTVLVERPPVVAPAPAVESKAGTFVEPMLASKMPEGKTADNFPASEYVMEEKYDGHRIIMAVNGGTVKAWSRLNNARELPRHIKQTAAGLPDGIYDGEIITPGGHSYDVTAGQNAGTEVLILFDVLHVMGISVLKEPTSMRRKLLEMAHQHIGYGTIDLIEQYEPSMETVQNIWDRGGEGTIIKRLAGPYRPGWRTPDWVKVKAVGAATVTITGFKEGESGPYSSVNVKDDAGIETTVKTLNNPTLREFAKDPESFIGRRLVISYHERTPSGKYRHPMFDHFAGEGE